MQAGTVFDHRGEYDENWQLPESLTLEQYSRVIFRPDAHFVDGEIIPRQMGDSVHSRMVGRLIDAIYPICKQSSLDCCISLRLKVSPTRIRVCDFVVLDHEAPREDVPTVPPLVCIEVLSPEQTAVDELDTLADYFSMGVPNIWLIDPTHRSAWTFDSRGLQEADPTHLIVADTPIRLDLTEAFAAID